MDFALRYRGVDGCAFLKQETEISTEGGEG